MKISSNISLSLDPPPKVKEVDIQMGTGLVTPKPRAEDQEGLEIFFWGGTLRRRKELHCLTNFVTDIFCDFLSQICDVWTFFFVVVWVIMMMACELWIGKQTTIVWNFWHLADLRPEIFTSAFQTHGWFALGPSARTVKWPKSPRQSNLESMWFWM